MTGIPELMTKIDPATIKSLFDLYRAGDYRALLEQAQALLKTWPDEPALHSLGRFGLPGDAGTMTPQSAVTGRRWPPGRTWPRYITAWALPACGRGRLRMPANSFHNAVKHDSQLAQAWFNLGIVL